MTTDAVGRTLTVRQARVLRFILEFFAAEGCPPSYRDICAAVGISSPNGVVGHLRSLARKGYIRFGVAARGPAEPHTARAIEVVGLTELLAPVVRRFADALLSNAVYPPPAPVETSDE